MTQLSATLKGLITGLLMIVASFIIFEVKGSFDNKLQYITYSLYVAGILWTLLSYERRPENTGKFGGYFLQGFRCFIVVVLLMVIFTAVFLQMHPELTEEMAAHYRSELLKQGNKTEREISEQVAMARKSFMPVMIMAAIFSYLAIGALITAVTSGVLMQRRQQRA